MKLTKTLRADDGDVTLDVVVRLDTDGTKLMRDEVQAIMRRAVREIAAALGTLPFTDFGIDNIRVR